MQDNRMKLRVIMAKNGLKSKDVAIILHRNQGTIRRYMCGINKISDELIIALKEHLAEEKEIVA